MANHSYMSPVPNTRQVLFTTIPKNLDRRAEKTPDKAAHIFRTLKSPTEVRRVVLTYKDLADQSLRLASAFLDLGIKPKDRIAMIGSNCPEYLFVDYACLRISVLLIRMPASLLNPDVMLKNLQKLSVKALILDEESMKNRLDGQLPGLLSEDRNERLSKYGLSSLNHIMLLRKTSGTAHGGMPYIKDLCQNAQINSDVYKIQDKQDPDDAALVYATSGTTGNPKFPVQSHFSMLLKLPMLFPAQGENVPVEDTILLHDRPFSWIGGMSIHAAATGATVVNMDPQASSGSHWLELMADTVKEEKPTDMFFMPKGLYDLKHSSSGAADGFSKVRLVLGGEVISLDLMQFARDHFASLYLIYGSTEVFGATRFISRSSPEKTEDIYHLKPLPFAEIKVTDDSGKVVPCDTLGQIHIRSVLGMMYYLDDDENTKRTKDKNGWITLGDMGSVNSDLRLSITGRNKDVISKGGLKVHPVSVEKLFVDNPKLREVVVIDVPDPRLFHEICACVIPKAGQVVTEDELRQYLRERAVDDTVFMEPRYFLIKDEFIRTTTGKVNKNALREEAKQIFNLK